MGYSNRFTLEVISGQVEVMPGMSCPKCKTEYSTEEKFCSQDGTQLTAKINEKPIDDLIARFRKESDDASYLLNDDGSSEESGNGYSIESDLVRFSKQYPLALFRLDGEYEMGLGENPSRAFIQDGKIQRCQSTLTFEEYDPSKMERE